MILQNSDLTLKWLLHLIKLLKSDSPQRCLENRGSSLCNLKLVWLGLGFVFYKSKCGMV